MTRSGVPLVIDSRTLKLTVSPGGRKNREEFTALEKFRERINREIKEAVT